MAGISYLAKSFDIPQNKYKFNEGSELSSEEFSDGSGLNAYETENRMFDHQVGRFWQIDILANRYRPVSPYVYGLNNPIYYNDATGLSTGPSKRNVYTDKPKELENVTVVGVRREPVNLPSNTSVSPQPQIFVKPKTNQSGAPGQNAQMQAGAGVIVLSNPEAAPVVAAAAVITYYLIQSVGSNNSGDTYSPPPGFLNRDNLTYVPPPVLLIQEEKTDENNEGASEPTNSNSSSNEKTADEIISPIVKRSPSYNPN
ncbi:MAG: RHS repeat-associated core domain-containing protein [Chitinophagaceae bacterium]